MVPERPTSSESTLSKVFKAYDVRGTVPDELNERTVFAIGAGFARFVLKGPGPADKIAVAHDMRDSGPSLSRAFSAGAMASGLRVIDLGLASTDLVYFASGHLDVAAAMLTASHNPAKYNGIKMCLDGARPVGEDTGLPEIRDLAEETLASLPGDFELGYDAAAGGVERRDLLDDFAAHVRSFVDTSRLRPLKVVADTANGMGGLVAPRVFDGLPLRLEVMYGELDGSFPNHPADPIQEENLADLRARLLHARADVGLAFDGDADRVFLVDERAQPLTGSLTTAIVAAALLDKHPGSTILYNLICSRSVPEVIVEHGGIPVRTRVGHSFIKAVMADTGALFGGEHSGHYYFRENYRADSGIIAALIVLEVLSTADRPLSELRRPFERYFDSGEINKEVANPHELVEKVAGLYRARGASIDTLDGITVELDDWWFNLRPSNTEPLLRLNLEAPDAESRDVHVREVLGLVDGLDRSDRPCP
jgi:phosphomannomutase